MPQPARKYSQSSYYYRDYTFETTYKAQPVRHFSDAKFGTNIRPTTHRKIEENPALKRRKKAKIDRDVIIARLVGISLLFLIGIFILPIGVKNIAGSIFTKSPYPNIKSDYNQILNPTINYLHNHMFLNELSLSGPVSHKKATMKVLPIGNEMSDLESSIKNILPLYPNIHAGVYVYDYDTGNYADINGEEVFSAASIIKLPVLIQLFKSIESNQVTLYDSMYLNDIYRAEGSGELQFKAEQSVYTLDYLAKVMITNSDNSATNMIMSKIGGMPDVNRGIRDWGLSQTHVQTWLPDLSGTNYTSAKDLARMLYNIENPKFLSDASKTKIYEYMSKVKNDRLLPAGLGAGASIVHKTGDIGKMLGDAGIVTTPNGKKYIVAILANRPYNSPEGKEFIVKASEIIYNYMVVK